MLLILTITLPGWFFITGWTAEGSEGRTEILAAAAERDQILAEMRQLLKAVDGVVRGIGEAQSNRQAMESVKRSTGMEMTTGVASIVSAQG